jgi:hypothetical protein
MVFDSPLLLLCAALLLAASIASWIIAARLKASARINLRFAAMLLAACAVAAPVSGIVDIVVLVALPPAGVALALASLARFVRRAPIAAASTALAGSLAAGLGAVILASPVLAAVPVALAAFVIAAAALQDLAWIAALSGVALLASVFAFLRQGAGPGMMLFAAVALLGLSRSAFAIEQQSDGRIGGPVGRPR